MNANGLGMQSVFIAYLVLGSTVLLLAFGAGFISSRLWVSEPLLIVGIGIAIGPAALGLFEPARWSQPMLVLEEVARLTLALSLMGAAFRLPGEWIRDHWRQLASILLLGMPLMWLISAACAWSLLGMSILPALLIGAIVTPTDPVVAGTIVTGRLAEANVSENVRHLLSAESGANDGLAFMLFMIPILLLERNVWSAFAYWSVVVVLLQVVGSIAVGIVFGAGTAKLLDYFHSREDTEHGSLLAVTVALPLALLGAAKLFDGDGLLAVFAAGLAFNWVIPAEEGYHKARHERIQDTIKRFFDVPVFLIFGMLLPWEGWADVGARGIAFVIAVLSLRRIPVLWLLRRVGLSGYSVADILFMGWFGPIAVAAMVYATWADGHAHYRAIWLTASLAIFASVVIHGITATPLTWLYGRKRS